MHVLLLPSSYAPKVGGLETAVAHLGAELVRRGHRVTVVTNRYPRTLPVSFPTILCKKPKKKDAWLP